MFDTSDAYLTIQHMVRTCPLLARATTGLTEPQNQLAVLPARLYPESALASRHPLRILRQARQTPRALALRHNSCSVSRISHPGVSYLFHNQMADESLWSVALGSTPLGGTAGPGGHPGPLNSPPPSWTPALGEHVLKVDGKFKVRSPPFHLRADRYPRCADMAIG
jgi:hypothetical protein